MLHLSCSIINTVFVDKEPTELSRFSSSHNLLYIVLKIQRQVRVQLPINEKCRDIYSSYGDPYIHPLCQQEGLDLDPGRAVEWREEEVQTPRFLEDVHN